MVKANCQKAIPINGMNQDEEDYRAKNAREGRAIYVPGRSVEEVRAELNKRPLIELSEVPGGFCITNTRTGSSRHVSDETGKPLYPAATSAKATLESERKAVAQISKKPRKQQEQAMITVTMTPDQFSKFENATAEVPYLLSHAGNVFDFLFSVKAAGFDAEDSGYLSIFELCGRAFRTAAEKEGEAIADLDRLMRAAKSAQIDAKTQPLHSEA